MTWKKQQYNDSIINKIEDILDSVGVEYKRYGNRVIGCCPIHGGDNKKAFNIYLDDSPNWICYTQHCEKKYGRDLFSLVKQLLGKSESEVIDYLGGPINTVIEAEDNFNYLSKQLVGDKEYKNLVSRSSIINRLSIPSTYFCIRGFSKAVLSKYDLRTKLYWLYCSLDF
jgi:hypothetical protein